MHSCNSVATNCLIEGLRCGQNYTASVIGTNLKCNSTASEEVTFMTGRSEGWLTLKLDYNIYTFFVLSGRRHCDRKFGVLWSQVLLVFTTCTSCQSKIHCTSNRLNPVPLHQLHVLRPTSRHSETVKQTTL